MTNLPAVREEMAPAYWPELTVEIIRKYLCPDATVEEAYLFLQLCKSQGLNPFLRDAYLVVYKPKDGGTRTVSMIVGKDTFTKRADAQPEFKGFRAGVIVVRNDEVVELEGTFYLLTDTLAGGWAEVKRADRSEPHKVTVRLAEYDTGFSQWRKMPATMIRKVALVQGLREAFPSPFRGLYDASEMGVDDALLPEAKVVVRDVETAAVEQAEQQAAIEAPKEEKSPEDKARVRLFIAARDAAQPYSNDDLHAHIGAKYGVTSTKDLTLAQLNETIEHIKSGKGPAMPEMSTVSAGAQKLGFG